jgi:hypothetical protein
MDVLVMSSLGELDRVGLCGQLQEPMRNMALFGQVG